MVLILMLIATKHQVFQNIVKLKKDETLTHQTRHAPVTHQKRSAPKKHIKRCTTLRTASFPCPHPVCNRCKWRTLLAHRFRQYTILHTPRRPWWWSPRCLGMLTLCTLRSVHRCKYSRYTKRRTLESPLDSSILCILRMMPLCM